MRLTRRSMLGACAGAVPALAAGLAGRIRRPRLAGARHPLLRRSQRRPTVDGPARIGSRTPARFLDHARSLGRRGVQVGLGARDDSAADALRERARAASMYLEGIVSLPRDQADVGAIRGRDPHGQAGRRGRRADRDALGTAVRIIRKRRRVSPVCRTRRSTP